MNNLFLVKKIINKMLINCGRLCKIIWFFYHLNWKRLYRPYLLIFLFTLFWTVDSAESSQSEVQWFFVFLNFYFFWTIHSNIPISLSCLVLFHNRMKVKMQLTIVCHHLDNLIFFWLVKMEIAYCLPVNLCVDYPLGLRISVNVTEAMSNSCDVHQATTTINYWNNRI